MMRKGQGEFDGDTHRRTEKKDKRTERQRQNDTIPYHRNGTPSNSSHTSSSLQNVGTQAWKCSIAAKTGKMTYEDRGTMACPASNK